MEKEEQHTGPNVLKGLAQLLGTKVVNRRLEIPEKYGRGYCTGFVFNEHIRMLIMNYELNKGVVLQNPDFNTPRSMVLFKFQNIFPKIETLQTSQSLRITPS